MAGAGRRLQQGSLRAGLEPLAARQPAQPASCTAASPRDKLAVLAQKILTPAGLVLHPRGQDLRGPRQDGAGQLPLDWGFTRRISPTPPCSTKGHELRVVGQDVGRGTFFHRHAVLHDQKTDGTYHCR